MPKIVPKGGMTTVHGVFVPEGTQMAVNILHMCRDTEVFGEDAHIFNPDRWIAAQKEDEGRYGRMCRTADMIFGNGKHDCLGKHIAWLELNKVYAEVRFFSLFFLFFSGWPFFFRLFFLSFFLSSFGPFLFLFSFLDSD